MVITDNYLFFWGGYFSNFYECDITHDGKKFKSSEQLFMYLKAKLFDDDVSASLILKCKTPNDAKQLGRLVKNFNNEKWDTNKEYIMRKALYAKFTQNKHLKDLLLKYRNKTFVEASPYDKVWGVGLHETDPRIKDSRNWQGQNLLGKALNNLMNVL